MERMPEEDLPEQLAKDSWEYQKNHISDPNFRLDPLKSKDPTRMEADSDEEETLH